MKLRTPIKFIILVVFIFVIGLALRPKGLLAYSSIRDPGGTPQGLPVRLQIPVIGVDSAIEDALITSDGRMDVPSGTVDVAWFALGPKPGQVGSAVIGGHYGIQNDVPFVFYNLNKLKVGDKIYVVNDKGETLAFIVKKIISFDRNADSTTVFTSHDGLAHLNVITCEGVWNQVNGNYPDRLVVFTDQIPGEGAVTVKKAILAPAIVKLPSTAIAPTSTTPAAVVTLNPVQVEKVSTTWFENVTQSIFSLYDNSVDGLITSVLILSIAFIIFKMIRRK